MGPNLLWMISTWITNQNDSCWLVVCLPLWKTRVSWDHYYPLDIVISSDQSSFPRHLYSPAHLLFSTNLTKKGQESTINIHQHSKTMISPSYLHCIPMIFPWYLHGISMIWYILSISMIFPWYIVIYLPESEHFAAPCHDPTRPTATGNAALLSPPACGKPQLTTLPSRRRAAKAAPKDHLAMGLVVPGLPNIVMTISQTISKTIVNHC